MADLSDSLVADRTAAFRSAAVPHPFSRVATRAYVALERHLLRFKRTKDVLCIVHNETMLAHAMPILEAVAADHRVRLWLFLPALHMMRATIRADVRRLGWRLAPRWMARHCKWDLVLYPSHHGVCRRDSPRIYIGHGLNHRVQLIHGAPHVFGGRSIEAPTGRVIYDKIFVAGAKDVEYVARYHPAFSHYLRVVGNPLMDAIARAADGHRSAALAARGLSPAKRTLLVCSTWRAHSLIRSYGRDLLERLKPLSQDYNIVITIHENNLLPGHSGGTDWRALLRSLEAQSGVRVLWDRTSPFEYLALADLLIADITSLAHYFLCLQRPMILLSRQDTSAFMPDSSIRDLQRHAWVPPRGLDGLEAGIARLLARFNAAASDAEVEAMCSYRGASLQRCVEEVRDSLGLPPPATREVNPPRGVPRNVGMQSP